MSKNKSSKSSVVLQEPTQPKWCNGCSCMKTVVDFHKCQNWCIPCSKDKRRRWLVNNPGKIERIRKRSKLRNLHGLNLEEFESMLLAQGYKCAICGEAISAGFTAKVRKTHVDHCHKTGSIRDLLCACCNLGLGSFRDNIEVLEKAIIYLKKHQQFPSEKISNYKGKQYAYRQRTGRPAI